MGVSGRCSQVDDVSTQFEATSGLSASERTRIQQSSTALAADNRVPEIDGLRGIAIALVVGLHMFIRPNSWLWNELLGTYAARLIDMAWCGVDVFFVLSGFLIGGIVLDHRKSPNFYPAFYARRTTRIFPAYFLLVAAAFVPLGAFGIHAASGQIPLAAYATFTANLFSASGSHFSYWLGPLWSICIEEQFYLLAPIILRLLPTAAIPWALGFIILASAGLRSAWSLGLVSHTLSYWDFTLTRLDGLGLGGLAAWAVRERDFMRWAESHRTTIRWTLGFLCAVCAWFSQQASALLLGPGIFFLSLAACITVLLLRLEPEGQLPRAFRARPLVFMGRHSYFIYLFHMPAFWLGQRFLYRYDETAPFVAAISLAVVLGLAVLSWRYFESPLLRLGRRVGYGDLAMARVAPVD